MGDVVEFTASYLRRCRQQATMLEPGETPVILILPVVRVDRTLEGDDHEPEGHPGGGRRRRRRSF